ncbi:hypothetical protein [Brassicibacter mesophilus]|uniref:hypothetical protein n=1 Tax=Brassicibacter mesophilus TaxID=745119 RepID=UPI003D2548C9
MSNNKESKNQSKRIIVTVIILLLLLIVSVLVLSSTGYINSQRNDKNQEEQVKKDLDKYKLKLTGDTDGIIEGELDLSNVKEIKLDLQAKTNASYVNHKVSNSCEFENGKAKGNYFIQNSPENKVLMQVEIEHDDLGIIYKSPVIKPNQGIESIKFDKELEKGLHKVTTHVKFYDMSSLLQVGKTEYESVKILIKN